MCIWVTCWAGRQEKNWKTCENCVCVCYWIVYYCVLNCYVELCVLNCVLLCVCVLLKKIWGEKWARKKMCAVCGVVEAARTPSCVLWKTKCLLVWEESWGIRSKKGCLREGVIENSSLYICSEKEKLSSSISVRAQKEWEWWWSPHPHPTTLLLSTAIPLSRHRYWMISPFSERQVILGSKVFSYKGRVKAIAHSSQLWT